jgi:hypothetical protein
VIGCPEEDAPQAEEIARDLDVHDLPCPVGEDLVRTRPALGEAAMDALINAILAGGNSVSGGPDSKQLPLAVTGGPSAP